MTSKSMLYEIRDAYDNPQKMYYHLIFAIVLMLPFFIIGGVFNEPYILFGEIALAFAFRYFLFTRVLDERHLQIQHHSNMVSFNLSIFAGILIGVSLVVFSRDGSSSYYMGKGILGFGVIMIFLNSLAEAYYRAKFSESPDEE